MSKQFPPINLPDHVVDITNPIKNKYDIKIKPSFGSTPTNNKQPINPTAYPQLKINPSSSGKLWSQQRRTFLK